MLRVRSTLRNLKSCFVLFYAWTAEAMKMNRLLRRILNSGGKLYEFYVRWSFSETEEEFPVEEAPGHDQEGDAEFDNKGSSQSQPEVEGVGTTRNFVAGLLQSMAQFLGKRRNQILELLHSAAERTGFRRAWPRELLEILFRDLSATLETASPSEQQKVKKLLARVFHPDKHPTAVALEKAFWHELFVALEF
jgi:hypothetical protein